MYNKHTPLCAIFLYNVTTLPFQNHAYINTQSFYVLRCHHFNSLKVYTDTHTIVRNLLVQCHHSYISKPCIHKHINIKIICIKINVLMSPFYQFNSIYIHTHTNTHHKLQSSCTMSPLIICQNHAYMNT